jgi:hypothetical protein
VSEGYDPSMRLKVCAASVSLAALLSACGTTGGGPRGASTTAARPSGTPATTTAQIVPTDDDAGGTPSEVFERAKTEMANKNLAHARVLFDRVVKADAAEHPDATPLRRAAMYNAALCSEELDETRDARDRFAELAKLPDHPDAVDANLRRARLDVEIEDWSDLGVAASSLLSAKDLGNNDRAEALALQGLATLHGGRDIPSATKSINSAFKLIAGNDVTPPHNAAAIHFAKGDMLRAEGLAITFIDPSNPSAPIITADFPTKMEARCQKVLDAQDEYVESINTRELKWAVRSGVRVASMYVDLHDAVVKIPPPKSATTEEKKQLFRGAMLLRYRILLEKGLGTIERTLNLEKAVNAKTSWLEHAKKAKATLEKQLADEKAELAKLPYTEAELKKALDEVGKPKPGA